MARIATPFYAAAALVAVVAATILIFETLTPDWLAAYLLAINLVAFLFYAFDKVFVRLLNALKFRVPEKVLIWGLALPGGVLGAVAAMLLLRHKTSPNERSFQIKLLVATLSAIAVGLALYWLLGAAG